MYISPTHPNPPKPREAPEETGEVLAELERDGGREVLRLTIREYLGRRYVGVWVWRRNQDGQLYPHSGASIRRGELAEAIRALQEAADRLDNEAEDRPARRDTRQ